MNPINAEYRVGMSQMHFLFLSNSKTGEISA